MNKVTLIGRLTKDPELKFVPGTGTAVATCTIAVDRKMPGKDGQKEVDFIPIVVWGKQAENLANYMTKGRMIGVAGRIQVRTYDAKDGTKRYVTEVVAEEVQYLDKSNGAGASQNTQNSNQGGFEERSFGEEMTPVDDGDIPF
jgi:single-strand DNA-binding protein